MSTVWLVLAAQLSGSEAQFLSTARVSAALTHMRAALKTAFKDL